jgi:hypothetical protein
MSEDSLRKGAHERDALGPKAAPRAQDCRSRCDSRLPEQQASHPYERRVAVLLESGRWRDRARARGAGGTAHLLKHGEPKHDDEQCPCAPKQRVPPRSRGRLHRCPFQVQMHLQVSETRIYGVARWAPTRKTDSSRAKDWKSIEEAFRRLGRNDVEQHDQGHGTDETRRNRAESQHRRDGRERQSEGRDNRTGRGDRQR